MKNLIRLKFIFWSILLLCFCSACRNHQRNISDGHSKTESHLQTNESVNDPDTALYLVGTSFTTPTRLDIKDISSLKSFIKWPSSPIIKSCVAKVESYQRDFSRDSGNQIFKINSCGMDLTCNILFGKSSNERVFYYNNKELRKVNIRAQHYFITDSMNLQIRYNESQYFEIKAKKPYLFIVSKSEQWTGMMSRHNFCQLVDFDALKLYEFISSSD